MEMETLMEQYLALQEELKAKDEQVSTLEMFKDDFNSQKDAYEKEINRLKETNMNLFLRVSQQDTTAIPVSEDITMEKEKPVQNWDSFMLNW